MLQWLENSGQWTLIYLVVLKAPCKTNRVWKLRSAAAAIIEADISVKMVWDLVGLIRYAVEDTRSKMPRRTGPSAQVHGSHPGSSRLWLLWCRRQASEQ